MKTKSLNHLSSFSILTRIEMKSILAGDDPQGLASCSASPTNCPTIPACSCDGSGTCVGSANEATCTCAGDIVTTVKCPIG